MLYNCNFQECCSGQHILYNNYSIFVVATVHWLAVLVFDQVLLHISKKYCRIYSSSTVHYRSRVSHKCN